MHTIGDKGQQDWTRQDRVLTYKVGRIIMWHHGQSNIVEKVDNFVHWSKIGSL